MSRIEVMDKVRNSIGKVFVISFGTVSYVHDPKLICYNVKDGYIRGEV